MTVNPNILDALKQADIISGCKTKLSNKQEILNIVQDKKTLQWMDFVKIANLDLKHYSPAKYSISLLVYYLENDLYKGKYKRKLISDLEDLKVCLNDFNYSYKIIFTENYDDVKFINVKCRDNKVKLKTVLIKSGNEVFTKIFLEYLTSNFKAHGCIYRAYYTFPISIGEKDLDSYKDINDKVFWNQINFYKKLYGEDETYLVSSIEAVCHFYRWVITHYSNYNFFQNSKTLTNELIQNNALVKNINRNAYFTTYGIEEDLKDKPLICFIIKNFDSYSTRINKISHIVIDSSQVHNSYYRTVLNKYIQKNQKIIIGKSFYSYILESLHFLESIKSEKDYPNKNLNYLNTQEAILIRNFVESNMPKRTLTTLNNNIGAVRRFLKWCNSNNYITVDTTFFDYLSQFEEPNKYYGKAIPDEDIKKISNEFIKLCKENENNLIYYAIFIILLETEFRASQVCALTTSALQPTLKKDQFYLYSNTKTTNGKKIQQPICLATKSILSKVMDLTEPLRNETVQKSAKNLIFLYKRNNSTIRPINVARFTKIFKKVCSNAKVKEYNTKYLRDTHMTKAFEYILKSGKSDLEMGLLSKHSVIDITKHHYIEIELTKMLESIYQVTLGERDVTQRKQIVDKLPNNLSNKETEVEAGCGHCNADCCNMIGNTPCLMCNHFVTTPNHKPYFVKMISNCDKLLSQTKIPHEKEDLTLIKTLYTNWLRELCIVEEEMENDRKLIN